MHWGARNTTSQIAYNLECSKRYVRQVIQEHRQLIEQFVASRLGGSKFIREKAVEVGHFFYISNLKQSEIAVVYGISQPAVHKHISTFNYELKKFLKKKVNSKNNWKKRPIPGVISVHNKESNKDKNHSFNSNTQQNICSTQKENQDARP